MKEITEEELVQKTVKASDLIESVLEDLRYAEERGLTIDMTMWGYGFGNNPNSSDPEDLCCVCLGGAAALGFCPELSAIELNGLSGKNGKEVKPHIRAMMFGFNHIRLAQYGFALSEFVRITTLHKASYKKRSELVQKMEDELPRTEFRSQLSEKNLKSLKNRIVGMVKILRRAGY